MRILFVSDLDSNTVGGGALIAERLCRDSFAYGHHSKFISYPQSSFQILRKLYSRTAFRFLRGIFNPCAMLMLYRVVRKFRPDVIWFHNVNNLWSWSILIPSFGVKHKLMTLHDLTSIYQHKITIDQLNESLKFLNTKHNLAHRFGVLLRASYIRFCVRNTTLISISAMQDGVLRANGIRTSFILNNYVEDCKCETVQAESRTILFAGRSSLKGLSRALEILKRNQEWTLILAGEPNLKDLIPANYKHLRISYIGQLSNHELLRRIHSVDYVFVLSEYFDTFPTIALEAIVHGSLPVTSTLTGVANIVNAISPKLVLTDSNLVSLPLIEPSQLMDVKRRAVTAINSVTDKDSFWDVINKVLAN